MTGFWKPSRPSWVARKISAIPPSATLRTILYRPCFAMADQLTISCGALVTPAGARAPRHDEAEHGDGERDARRRRRGARGDGARQAAALLRRRDVDEL